MRLNVFAKVALAGAAAFITLATTPARAQEVLFLSTQLRPVEEAQKVRQVILRGGPAGVNFLVEEPSPFTVRMNAETQAGKRTISMVGALHGELQPLVGSNTLDNVDDLVASATSRGAPASLIELGKLGTANQVYIPWMQATYVMAAKKRRCNICPPAPT